MIFMGFPPLPPCHQTLNTGIPVGAVIAFAGNIRDSDSRAYFETNLNRFHWRVCDGSKLQINEYPELYYVLGDLYGGDTEHFYLPDLRGTFLRGVDQRDKEKHKGSTEQRTSVTGQSYTGVGSNQQYALQSHTHGYEKSNRTELLGGEGAQFTQSLNSPSHVDAPEENKRLRISEYETRPVNTFIYWLIKTAR